MEVELDLNTMRLLKRELLARKSNSCMALSNNDMVPRLGPKETKRAPSPMTLNKKQAPKEDVIDLNDFLLYNSDEEHETNLKDIKISNEDRLSDRRKTIKLSTDLEEEANNLLKYKITLSTEHLYHMKKSNSIINFMKNNSDKNVRSLYEEINSIDTYN